jgi:hypothetical protein
MSDLENESLETHVALCQLRYESLTEKLDTTNKSVDELKDSMKGLKETMEAHITRNNTKALSISQWIIGVLLTGLGAIVLHLLFK